MSTLERLGSGSRSRASAGRRTVALAIGAGLIACTATWAVGLKSGYAYAKQDAARVLAVGMANEIPLVPSWRAWADTPVQYSPPADLEMLFGVAASEVPYSGGMTTGDVWSGYQSRLRREFFGSDRIKVLNRDDSPAPRACPPDADGNRDHGDC